MCQSLPPHFRAFISVSQSVYSFLSLIKTLSWNLGPSLIHYTLTLIRTLNIHAMTLFPNKSHFEVLDGHEFGWDIIQLTHTPFIAVPVCGYCVSVSGDSHLPETEAGLSFFFRFELV